MSIIRDLGLNLVSAEKTAKVGVKTKCLKAGWNDDDLLLVVTGQAPVGEGKT